MDIYDHLDLEDTWEVIHDAFLLYSGQSKADAEYELEIYRKWIPIFNAKFKQNLAGDLCLECAQYVGPGEWHKCPAGNTTSGMVPPK